MALVEQGVDLGDVREDDVRAGQGVQGIMHLHEVIAVQLELHLQLVQHKNNNIGTMFIYNIRGTTFFFGSNTIGPVNKFIVILVIYPASPG
jgi:hypothetical protein